MAYNVVFLDNIKLKDKHYLFDANLWLRILKPAFYQKPKDEKYRKFFEKFRNADANARIALPVIILSEVINRSMREFAMNKYLDANKIDRKTIGKGYYKEKYRTTQHFKDQYEIICDDIRAFHNLYDLVNDECGKLLKTNHIITGLPPGVDFNDNFYYQLAKKKNYSIITDDGDFFVEDVEICTYNEGLYQKYKDTIKPIQG